MRNGMRIEQFQPFTKENLGAPPPSNHHDHPLKEIRLSIFGLDRVGKTALVKRFLFETFDQMYEQTIEDVYQGDITYHNQKCDLTIVDMGGYRQFPAMRRLAIQKSDGILLVYSVDSATSFQEVKRLYDIIVEVKGNRDIPILLVGNKDDISLKRVTPNEVCSSIKNWGSKVHRIETSAKTNKNVGIAFHRLIEMIDETKHEQVQIHTLKDMTRTSIHRLTSILPITFPSSSKTVHNIKIQSRQKSRRRRMKSLSVSDNDEHTTTSLLYSTLSPIVPTVCKYISGFLKKQKQ